MSELRQFELLEGLSPFGSAKAALLRWNGARYVPTNEEIEIFDFMGTPGHRRDRGYTRFIPESKKWEAISGFTSESWMPM